MTLSGARRVATMLLVTLLLTMTAQTAWADTWPEYITDVILVGGTESEVATAKAAHSDYTFISQDLNDNAGGDYIYLGYKKGSRANVNGGYITDIIVVTEGSNPIPTGNISILGRTYNKAAIYGGNRFVNDRKGDLNSGAGGWGLWLYYTKQEYGTTKRAVSEITFNGTSSGSVNCYNLDGSLKQEGINMNRGCSSGDNIYMHLTTPTKTNRPSVDPVMASGLVYDGSAKQLITTAATLASGTMYYRIGTSGEWKTSISELTATNAGGYTVQYYAGSTSYSDASSTHSTTVSIGKSPNNGLTVSCPKVDVGGTLSPSLVGTNLSTGSTTYKYATSQDGDYTTTKPTAGGLYWVKATIAGDTNCDEYTTPAVKTSIAMGNVTVTSSTTEWLDGGTYNVTSNVTISSRIIINGDVTLNLGAGKTLTANRGIELSSGNKLTITGSGTLTATGYANDTPLNGIRYSSAAIGACNFGELVINSGTVNASSPENAAGIGGSYNITEDKGNSREGSVTINGGIVNANGGKNAAALGGSYIGSCMKITINGGQVTLRKCSYNVYSYALGRGLDGSSGATVTVGWTNADDFIDHDGCNQSVSFVSGKLFVREGSTTPATSSEFRYNAGKYVPLQVALANEADNSSAISSNNGETRNVVLQGRTLYKDGKWNTLCLPFDVTIAGSVLDGDNVQAMTLNNSTSALSGSTLTLNFVEATNTTIPAGTPFIIKWDGDGSNNLVNPVFMGVTISNANRDVTSTDGKVSFKGTYAYQAFDSEDKSILLVGGSNLYWPQNGASLGACRAYFELSDGASASEFVLNFDGETTGIRPNRPSPDPSLNNGGEWYDLSGRKLTQKPTQKGVYIVNGKKVVVK